MMSPSRHLLVGYSVLLVLAMALVVPWLTREWGTRDGYAASFLIYWFAFCLPGGIFFQGKAGLRRHLAFRAARAPWAPALIAAQVALVAVAGWILRAPEATILVVGLALACGVMNGFCEEFFWRGAYLAWGPADPVFQIVGLTLFGAFHVSLALAHGVDYAGGPVALIGGALALGAVWTVVAYRTGAIGWPMLGHMATNAVTFVGLIQTNFVAANH